MEMKSHGKFYELQLVTVTLFLKTCHSGLITSTPCITFLMIFLAFWFCLKIIDVIEIQDLVISLVAPFIGLKIKRIKLGYFNLNTYQLMSF